jgi:hypothetical protein
MTTELFPRGKSWKRFFLSVIPPIPDCVRVGRGVVIQDMSQLSLNKFSENLPVSGTIGLTQAAAGLGLGLLIADKMSGESRRRAGSVLLVAGALALAPVIASVVSRVRNRPLSTRRAQRHLDSIREDVGFHDSEHLI